MTAKKKTLIELMLDAGVTPEGINGDFIVCDKTCTDESCADEPCVRPYTSKPSFDKRDDEWSWRHCKPDILILPYFIANWKSTIITKQQFIDAYNEKNKPVGNQQKTLDEAFCEPVAKLNVTVENNTQHTIHADLSDIDTEKFKREFHEAGKHCALTPDHYSIIDGKDLIARFAESYKTDEFRGAMRFNIEKYIDRLGKKDSLVKELRKIADYATRWAEYEEKLQGSK